MNRYQRLLRHLGDRTSARDASDLHERVLADAAVPERSRAPWLAVPALAAAAALAFWFRADPVLGAELASVDPHDLAVTPELSLRYQGQGAVSGTRGAPRIAWDAGTLSVDLEPDRGVDLVIDTPEGIVRVVGTAFDVTRDRLGTVVAVQRGAVEVRCSRGEDFRLGAGDRAECLPQRPAGMLGRARALQESGAAAAEVLAAVRLGIADADGPVRSELLALEIAVRAESGDAAEALRLADRFLADGHEVRRTDVLRTAARLALPSGCDAALPYLAELARVTDDPSEREVYATCAAR